MLKMKDLNIIIIHLNSIVSCDILSLAKKFQGTYFGHAFFKACEYDLVNEKICKGLKYVYVKTTQSSL
jgi:hypothetical protein